MLSKYSKKDAKKDLPLRIASDNKTHGGKCLVIAGSKDLYGSAILTCLAAARTGAGYTYLHTAGKFPITKHPDFILQSKRPQFKTYSAIAMGPGYLKLNKLKTYLNILRKQKIKNVVLDAEALNCLAHYNIKPLPSWILTPHEGELSRILKVSSLTIRSNRKKYVLMAQKDLGCIVVLKGNKTLVADTKNIWEIQSGNPALAKAGTGDVLTGMILGFLSQNMNPVQAATLACYVHGFIADTWIQSKKDVLSLMASDMIELLPNILFKIRSTK